jgi:class 3 adenylate cyclase/predicted ATPase
VSRVRGLASRKSKRQRSKSKRQKFLIPGPQPPISYTPAHLAERIRAEQEALEARTGTEGERKTITALFADLKGSTALIEGLDPEEARAIIDPALQIMMDAVHRYEGYVAQALGDGIFALFGAPLAHEDHPQRALYAALRMQEEMRRYSDQLREQGCPPLLMRVGVNTGEVVVRSIRKDDLHADYVPVGHSTNLAARMEQLAAPGSILVTAYTQKLTDGYFAFKALGQAQIKGVEEPLEVYEVLGAGPLRTRLQVASRRGLTRFVGRQGEMAQMLHALAQTRAGRGQIVGVMGEPGLGKSRLFHEFVGAYCNTPLQDRVLVLQAYSVSYGKASPYLPVIELLKSYFDITPEDDERKRREKITGKVLTLERGLEDTLPYLFVLLGIEDRQSSLQQMDAQIRRRRTFEALKKLFLRESLNHPLILIFEDLHWIDTETQGFLNVLSESVASARLLLLVNYRPEYRHEWGSKTYYTQLRLAPFGTEEAEEFLDALLGISVGADRRVGPREAGAHVGAPLQALKHLILQKTEGTPFFMEEVVQELVEQGLLVRSSLVAAGLALPTKGAASSIPTAIHLPTTVQGVLAARIDRLTSDEKALLQQLAVIGRMFPLSLVKQVVTQPEEELYRLLSSLQHKEFLYEQPALPEPEYIFKHALTQEVAYGTVLHGRRKALHERTAQATEALYPSQIEEHYSELAHHYSHSSNTQKAVEYLHLAGQQAVQRSAYADAVSHLATAVELLKTLPDTLDRIQQELALQTTPGPALMATKGYGVPEVKEAYVRARDLCQQVGEPPQLFWILGGLWQISLVQADYQAACELGEQLLSIAQRVQDPAFLLAAHRALGEPLFLMGELTLARTHLEQGIALYNRQQHRTLVFLMSGVDPGVMCLNFAANILWHQGYPAQALRRSHEAIMLAQELSHSFSLADALFFAAELHQSRREWQQTQERAEAAMTLSSEQGFALWLAGSTIYRGWVLTERGQIEEGIVKICQGMADWRTTGAEVHRPLYLGLLAEAYGKAGQAEEGLAALAEALKTVDNTGGHFYEAELYRLKGELLLAQEGKSQNAKVKNQKSEILEPKSQILEPHLEAEACFHKAIDIARHQQAKSLELRATVSLVRLWQQQGKRTEAHQMLSKIHNWFTEGFDTKDLREAKALLAELSL